MAKMGYEDRVVHYDWKNKRPRKYGYQFRSDIERKWADYLEMLRISGNIESWEYEPRRFEFKERYRTKGVYTPDFHVKYALSDEWHEVKSGRSLTQRTVYKFKQMSWDYPMEKIVLIYPSCPKGGKKKTLIENAQKYIKEIIYAAPIFRKLNL